MLEIDVTRMRFVVCAEAVYSNLAQSMALIRVHVWVQIAYMANHGQTLCLHFSVCAILGMTKVRNSFVSCLRAKQM